MLDTTCWDNMTPLNEAYFGETPHLTNALRALSQLRAKYTRPKYQFDTKCYEDPLLMKYNREMEEEFGFGVFALSIDPSIQYNACTMPIGMKFDTDPIKNPVQKTKNGYKFKKEANYACIVNISAGILFNPKFTDREVMAIILHEVGHNFAGAVNGAIGLFEGIHRTITLLIVIILFVLNPVIGLVLWAKLSNSGNKWLIDFSKQIRKEYPNLVHFLDALGKILNNILDVLGEINFIQSILVGPGACMNAIFNYLKNKGQSLIFNPVALLQFIYGYPHEKFADGFPALYGYGPDLSSGLAKFTTSNYGLMSQDWVEEHAPLVAALRNIILLPVTIIVHTFDEHPIAIERAASNIRLLREELKHCDPKMRKRIDHDIKLMDEDIKKYYTYQGKLKDVNVGPRVYYSIVYFLVGGDFRHHWMDYLFKTKESMTTEGDKKK